MLTIKFYFFKNLR